MASNSDRDTCDRSQYEFKSASEVPDSHVWPTIHDHPCSDATGPDAMPVVDLSSPDAVALVGTACKEWGAFHVTGHGVPLNLLDRLESQMRRLFALPTDQKLKAARGPDKIAGYGVQALTPDYQKHFWSEGYTVLKSPRDDARCIWPEDYAEFCDVIEGYSAAMKELGARLVILMLLSLGLSEQDIVAAGALKDFDEAPHVLQLNSYPACPDPDRAIGLHAHNDTSLVTILYQSSTPGLQVLRVADQNGPTRWVRAPVVPGALVVNLGDISQILCNDMYHSVHHRAVVNRTEHRLSAAYFCGPADHVKIAPAEKLVGPEGPVYPAVTFPQYLGIKQQLFGKALDSIKLPK